MKETFYSFAKPVKFFANKNFKNASALFFALVVMPLVLYATHFRYGSISWTNTSGNTVVFKISESWRRSAFGNPNVGATVNLRGDGMFNFGDGTPAVQVVLRVTSVNVAEDWFYGEATITHTYASPGTYTAYAEDCCRISTLQNNANGSWRIQTRVNVGSGNSSPVSTIIPIIDVPANTPSHTFNITASDPNGSAINYRLSSPTQASGSSGGHVQPAGLSINPSSGQITFNTVGKSVGHLYTTQVMMSDGAAETPLDFIIRVSNVVGTAPYFVHPPTPANGSTVTVIAGQTATFGVEARDDDAGNTVSLTVAGAPVGSNFAPALPTSGNPVSSVFSWNTTTSDVGIYVLTFNAQDNAGQTANTGLTIQVIQDQTAPTTWYRDWDNDGFGDPKRSVTATSQPAGYVSNHLDCNDYRVFYQDNDNDGWGNSTKVPCGLITRTNDCNDNDPRVHSLQTFYRDADGDFYGDANNSITVCSSVPPAGYVKNRIDCNDNDAKVYWAKTYYRDADGDGLGDPNNKINVCSSTPPAGYVANSRDTNDTPVTVSNTRTDKAGDALQRATPDKFTLAAYPNPFNRQTRIQYTVPVDAQVNIKVFDVLGREVSLLFNGQRNAGTHYAEYNPEKLAGGLYYIRLAALTNGKEHLQTLKLVKAE